MRKIFCTILLLCTVFVSFAQQADDIIGHWKNGEGTGIIQIYKTTSGHYAGKIVWLRDPIDPETGKPKLDKRNPEASKRTQPTLGLVNMHGFRFDAEDKKWEHGKIYDPKNGKEYACKITAKDKDHIDVRGYIGVSIIGRTDTWTRVAPIK